MSFKQTFGNMNLHVAEAIRVYLDGRQWNFRYGIMVNLYFTVSRQGYRQTDKNF